MSKYRNGGNPDNNQKEIVKSLRKLGAKVVIVSEVSNFVDLVIGYKGKLFIAEIKDGTKSPSQRKLTAGELKCKKDFEMVGVDYHIITNIEEAIKMIEKL